MSGAHDAPDAILIADAADLAIGKIDLDHVLRRANQGQGLVGVSVEDLGGVIAALVGRDIGVAAFDVERDPMRPLAARRALREDPPTSPTSIRMPSLLRASK